MKLKKWLIAGCLALITSFAQALTLEERAQLEAWQEKTTHLLMDGLNDNLSKKPVLPSSNSLLGQMLNQAMEKGYQTAMGKLAAHANHLAVKLALTYYQSGKFDKALPLLEKVYRSRLALLGEKHPETVESLSGLGSTYLQLGQLDEALPLLEKAYRSRLGLFGEKHPKTFESLNNLSVIYQQLGRFSEALTLQEKAYRLVQEGFGQKPLYTLISLNQLAFLYQEIGRLDEALPLYEKSYRLAKEVLGEKHHQTIVILNNLAFLHRKLGHLDEALSLFEKVYRLAHEAFGDKHITITALNHLAETHRELKHLEKARYLFIQAYQLARKAFGEKHLKTITYLNNLGTLYIALGRTDEALPLIEKSYRLFGDVLGETNPSTLTVLNNLAGLYVEHGQTQKGIEHFEQLVAGIESLRRSDLSAENRQAWFQQWVVGYFVFASLYIKESRPLDAFRLAEMSKARTLLESLATKLAAQQSGLTATEQQQLRDSEARLAFLNNNIAKALENKRLEEKIYLETEKNQRVSRFNEFHRQLMAKYPKYAQLSEVQIVGAQEGAKYLPAEAVFISYLVAKDKVNKNQVLAFILQPDGTLTTHNLGKIPHLKKDLESYQRQLSLLGRGRPIKRSPKFHKDIETLSRELGKQLLGPLSALIKDKSHWIISPDGLLALLPFETLRIE
ncbi:MAG: hypothetical protein DRR19_08480, partial [Candidatus Parabeggiatoa sp. nov. 1]